jgi:hypothetical protein
MKLFEAFFAVEPAQHLFALQLRRALRAQRAIRRPRPLAKVIHEAVLLRVEMDVENEIREITVRRNLDATKVLLE